MIDKIQNTITNTKNSKNKNNHSHNDIQKSPLMISLYPLFDQISSDEVLSTARWCWRRRLRRTSLPRSPWSFSARSAAKTPETRGSVGCSRWGRLGKGWGDLLRKTWGCISSIYIYINIYIHNIYIHIYICIYIHIYIHISIYIYILLCVSGYWRMGLCFWQDLGFWH